MGNKAVTLTVAEAAEILGISRSSAYEAVRVGQIPALTFGKRIVVPISALEELTGAALNQNEDQSQHPNRESN